MYNDLWSSSLWCWFISCWCWCKSWIFDRIMNSLKDLIFSILLLQVNMQNMQLLLLVLVHTVQRLIYHVNSLRMRLIMWLSQMIVWYLNWKTKILVTLDQLIQHSLNALKGCVQGDSVSMLYLIEWFIEINKRELFCCYCWCESRFQGINRRRISSLYTSCEFVCLLNK